MKKHIVCFGDSNTHGYCADPHDCADGGDRFNENERWTCLLQKKLGEDYLVLEEGLSGRTTVFTDPLHESMAGVESAYAALMSHEPIDLLIIMLGTNDTKERFGANAPAIAVGMQRLLLKCKSIPCWGTKAPNILVVCPPALGKGFHDEVMGQGCVEKSEALPPYLEAVAKANGAHYLNAGDCEFNSVDFTHLSTDPGDDHGKVIEILKEENFNQIIAKEPKVIVDFYATWCGPCKAMSPIFIKLSKEITDVKFLKVSEENGSELIEKYDVAGFPTFVLFKNGEMVDSKSGKMDEKTLKQFIKS